MADDSGSESVGEVTLEPTTVVRSRRPRALWVVLAAAVVAVGALAVNAGDDGADGPPRLPVSLDSPEGQAEADGAMAADSMLAFVTYRPGDDLPAMGGSAPAYRLTGGYDEAAIAALHASLAIDEPITEQDGFWQSRGSDGRYLEVFDEAGSPWWYTAYIEPGGNAGGGSSDSDAAPTASSTRAACSGEIEDGVSVEEDCPPDVISCEVGGDCPPCVPGTRCEVVGAPTPVEEQPTPSPADLPSEDEARQIALDFLVAAGVAVDGATVTVDGPYDAWYVNVEPVLDGTPVAGLSAMAAVGPEGVVTTASGHLGSPERLGEYPLLDTSAAIDRLNAQQGMGYASDTPAVAGDAPASDAAESAYEESPETTLYLPCETQEDGSEICAGTGGDPGHNDSDLEIICMEPGSLDQPGDVSVGGTTDGAEVGTTTGVDLGTKCVPPEPDPCFQAVPPRDAGDVATAGEDCPAPTPLPEPMPMPEPEVLEVVLTEVEPVLVLLPADDGTSDAYLVPGYRFRSADGHVVEVPAVDDDSITPTTAIPDTMVPDTTVLDTDEPPPDTAVPPPVDTGQEPGQAPECEVLVEQDESGTTHTMALPCPPETTTTVMTEPEAGEQELGR